MQYQTADAELVRKCFVAACVNIERNKEYINAMNVFPVPDGDTGTNVSMTLSAALTEVEKAPLDMGSVCRAISQGALRGARGNSGVIFSQLLRGFTKAIRDLPEAGPDDLAQGMRRATETAYKAVMKPKEGTILTVARGMSEKITELAPAASDITELLQAVCEYGEEVLSRTPEQLPVLKEAGVVDSGGMALVIALRGAVSVLAGTDEELLRETEAADVPVQENPFSGHVKISTDEIRFGYCTECIINLEKEFGPEDEKTLSAFLENIGDSVVCVADEGVVKLHVHTNHPGLVFEKGLEYGSLSRLKVDNLREEHEERILKELEAQKKKEEEAPLKDRACVAVCAGKGLSEIFRKLGADCVIEGGQTMNPSIDDILTACRKVHAKEVLVLPNNKNIILASRQAELCTEDRFRLVTVPTKSVVQGISAMLQFDPSMETDDIAAVMEEAAGAVKSGEVTYAVRNTQIDGIGITEGDYMGIADGKISSVGKDLNETALAMIGRMAEEEPSFISVYYGSDVNSEQASALLLELTERYQNADIDLEDGGQPVYYYFVSVE